MFVFYVCFFLPQFLPIHTDLEELLLILPFSLNLKQHLRVLMPTKFPSIYYLCCWFIYVCLRLDYVGLFCGLCLFVCFFRSFMFFFTQ